MPANIHSLHHFFFPCRWDVLPAGFKKTDSKEDCPFDERTCLESFHGALMKSNKWKRTSFKIDKIDDYNEFSYFYSFVRKTLYDVDEYSYGSSGNKREVLRYYEFDIDRHKHNQYIITYLAAEGRVSTLFLTVSGISLHVFDTGIGILSFNLVNEYPGQDTPDQILLINEFGRRIYPQFLGKEFVSDTQCVFLAKSITLVLEDSVVLSEDFGSYKNLSLVNPNRTFNAPKFIEGLFDDNFAFHIEGDLKVSRVLLSRVMDDRLFFLCWYGNNNLCKNLADLQSIKADHLVGKIKTKNIGKGNSADWWYAFIFGDRSPKSIANAEMQAMQIEQHTYARWLEYGTLYGMSRDSFVCISPDINYMDTYKLPRLDVHTGSIYYQFVILCLAQKASVLKFSAEIANLSDTAVDAVYGDRLAGSVKSIYGNYIEFVNKIYFREVSSQIQAIEMYNQFQGVMSVANDVARLDAQIATLFNYLSFQKDERQNNEAHKLTRIATWFLPASLIASLFGIGFITENTSFLGDIDGKVWIAWSIILGLGVIISWLIFRFRNRF